MWVRINVRERLKALADLKLCVLDSTQLWQLRELILLRLAEQDVPRGLSLRLIYDGRLCEDDKKPLGRAQLFEDDKRLYLEAV